MKTDNKKTVVTFYREPYNESETQILAVFPKISEGKNLFLAYSHIGQHSKAQPEYLINKCEPCTEASEYSDLQKELEGLGYNLTITNVVNVIKPTRKNGLTLLKETERKQKERNSIQDLLSSLIESCEQGYNQSWDCSTDEGREGFLPMIDQLREIKTYIEEQRAMESANVLTNEQGDIVAIIQTEPTETYPARLKEAIEEDLVTEIKMPAEFFVNETFIVYAITDGEVEDIKYEFYLTPTSIY